MLESLLPLGVVVVETKQMYTCPSAYGAEQAVTVRAVEKRRREFVTGRECAREALCRLGVAPAAILRGVHREPIWPTGVVGSITHCDGFCAAAVTWASTLRSVGIDAEPNEPLPAGVLRTVAFDDELDMVQVLARTVRGVHWDRVLFSAKESVYKTWFPLTQRWLGYEDASMTFDPAHGTFAVDVHVPGPVRRFAGRWKLSDGLLVTAVSYGGTQVTEAPATALEACERAGRRVNK
jgi:4'-phosphopantetheinyl transferase EntD